MGNVKKKNKDDSEKKLIQVFLHSLTNILFTLQEKQLLDY